jgi:hypothetical protein
MAKDTDAVFGERLYRAGTAYREVVLRVIDTCSFNFELRKYSKRAREKHEKSNAKTQHATEMSGTVKTDERRHDFS